MDIFNELKLYINNKEHNGAILVNRNWGCGKTYLINNLKKEIDSDDRVVLIVSLFGIDSISSLIKAVKDKILKVIIGLEKKQKKRNMQTGLVK